MNNKNPKFPGSLIGPALLIVFMVFPVSLSSAAQDKDNPQDSGRDFESIVSQYSKEKLIQMLKISRAELSLAKKTLDHLNEAYSQKDAEYRALNEKIEKQAKDSKNCQSGLSGLTQEKEALNKKFQALKEDYAKLSEQLAHSVVSLSDTDKQKQDLNTQIQDSRQESEQLHKKLVQAENLRSMLQQEADNLRNQRGELAAQLLQGKNQREQESAILNAEIEQVKAHKEGEIAQLNAKYQELKSHSKAESESFNAKIDKLTKDLQDAQGLSYQLVQEKGALSTQQKELSARLKENEEQLSIQAEKNKKLEEQAAFLKNQYVDASQDLSDFKKEYAKLAQAKPGVVLNQETAKKAVELEASKKDLLEKTKDYSKQIQEYEQKIKNKEDVENRYKALTEDFSKLKESYEKLQKRYLDTEETKQRHETVQNQYAKLPEENVTLHYNLGVLYAQNQKYQEAVAELEKVLEIKPDDADSHYNLGLIYGEYLNDRKKAIMHFKKYLALVPADADTDRVRKYILTWETLDQEIKQ